MSLIIKEDEHYHLINHSGEGKHGRRQYLCLPSLGSGRPTLGPQEKAIFKGKELTDGLKAKGAAYAAGDPGSFLEIKKLALRDTAAGKKKGKAKDSKDAK
jgi:hypothetical protein